MVAGVLILLLSLWIVQAKRNNQALTIANINTANANMALNELKNNLEQNVLERTLQLTISENRYRGLVESLEDEYIFYQHDIEGFIQYVSPSVTHILGLTISGFGEYYYKYLTDNPKNKLISGYIQRIINGEKLAPFEMEIFAANGIIHTFEVLERPMYD